MLDPARGGQASIAVRERAIGCLVGAAVGDALGAPFEFLPAGTYRRRFPQPHLGGTGEMVGGGSFGWEPGEFTDDTQMALVLARSLLTQGYDIDDVWHGWRVWAAGSSDVGNATRVALSQPDWREVRHRDIESTAGNGSLMRAFPLALATLTTDDELARTVVLHQALTTHHHPAAAWGAWLAVAGMRAAILTGAVASAPLAAIDAQLEVMDALAPEEVERFRAMLAPGWTPADATVGNGSVWGCLAQAVWALRTTATFADAVTAVIDLGSDADTVACVTGALAGAALGVQSIPSRWSTYVHGRLDTDAGEVRLALADIQLLALELLGVAAPGFQERDAAVGPHPIEGRLHAANLAGAAATTRTGRWCRSAAARDCSHDIRCGARSTSSTVRAGTTPGWSTRCATRWTRSMRSSRRSATSSCTARAGAVGPGSCCGPGACATRRSTHTRRPHGSPSAGRCSTTTSRRSPRSSPTGGAARSPAGREPSGSDAPPATSPGVGLVRGCRCRVEAGGAVAAVAERLDLGLAAAAQRDVAALGHVGPGLPVGADEAHGPLDRQRAVLGHVDGHVGGDVVAHAAPLSTVRESPAGRCRAA
jgi:ADP-ribosyl-[dinitrogen reductase] hydrolase